VKKGRPLQNQICKLSGEDRSYSSYLRITGNQNIKVRTCSSPNYFISAWSKRSALLNERLPVATLPNHPFRDFPFQAHCEPAFEDDVVAPVKKDKKISPREKSKFGNEYTASEAWIIR
jgi:hypothetical protein